MRVQRIPLPLFLLATLSTLLIAVLATRSMPAIAGPSAEIAVKGAVAVGKTPPPGGYSQAVPTAPPTPDTAPAAPAKPAPPDGYSQRVPGAPDSVPAACGVPDYVISKFGGGAIVAGTVDTGNHTDDGLTTITLPFAYTLYDQSFTSAAVSSNGQLDFLTGDSNYFNAALPDPAASFAIFPHWDDLDTRTTNCANCGIFTSTSGSAPNRIFNIEWRTVLLNTTNAVNFEVRLYEAQARFDVIYGTVTNNGVSATIGVQRDTGSQWTQYSFNTANAVATGTMLTFTLPGSYTYSQGVGTIVAGTVDTGNHTDDGLTTITLPFAYTLYDQSFTSAAVSSNGQLDFLTGDSNYFNAALPDPAASFAIFPHWDDLDTRTTNCANCGIFTSTSGSAPNRIFNIEWRTVLLNTTNPVNFEVRLYEGQTKFDVIYGTVTNNGVSATIGVQRDTGSRYTQVSYNTAVVATNMMLTFTLPPSGYVASQSVGASIVAGTVDTGNHTDDGLTTITLPFAYTLYDQSFTSAAVSSNGQLDFLTGDSNYFNAALPDPAASFAIFPHWDDLDTRTTNCANCGIFTSTSGSAPNRIFNIEWRTVLLNTTNPVNFEVRLYEGQTKFDVIYGTVTNNGVSATIGVQRDTGSRYTQVSYNQVSISAGMKLTFLLPGCPRVQWTALPDSPGAALAAPGLYFDPGTNASQVFVGGLSGKEIGYNGATGSRLWSQALGAGVGIHDRSPIITIGGVNLIFLTSDDGYVTALRVSNGTPLWTTQIGTSVVAGVAFQPNVNVGGTVHNLIFAGTYNNGVLTNKLVALDASTGAQVWQFTNGTTGFGIVPTRPAVDLSSNTVYFGTNWACTNCGGGAVWAVDTTTGNMRWSNTSLGRVVGSTPALSDDGQTLYLGLITAGGSGVLNAIRTSNGTPRASFTMPTGYTSFQHSAWSEGTSLYIGVNDRLYAFTDTGGSTLPFNAGWTAPYNGGPGYATIPGLGTPLLLSDAGHQSVYAGGSNGYFYKLNMSNGTLNNNLYLGAPVAVSDATYDVRRNAFYVTVNGALYSIDGNW